MDIRNMIDSNLKDDLTYKEVYVDDLLETIRELDSMDFNLIAHFSESNGEISNKSRYYYTIERIKLIQAKLQAKRDLYQIYKDGK